jgi:hypothetical protein
MKKSLYRLARRSRRTLGQLRRPLRRLGWRWRGALRPREDGLSPSPAVAAFIAGETERQAAYFVGSADPGVIDPREDWVGAVNDVRGLIRAYIDRQAGRIADLESALASAARADGAARPSLLSQLLGWLRPYIGGPTK